MPPPPMPANLDPTTVSSNLPSGSPRVLTSKLSSLPSLSGAQTSDPPASPSPSTPFANLSLLSPTASHSSNSSPLSPKLSTLTSSFLSITPTLALSPDADPPSAIQMDVDKDLHASDPTQHRARSPSPRPLSSSEPLRRLQLPPMSREESPSPTPPSRQTSSVPGPLPDAEPPPPPAPSSPRTAASPPPPPSPQTTPKVKMSLKDFAMRKKKQREEEQARVVVVPPESLHSRGQSGTSATSDPPSDPARDRDGCEESAPTVATDNTRSDCGVESHGLIVHAESEAESSASTKAEIALTASTGYGRPLQDATRATTSSAVSNTNGVLRRLSRTASPPPSPSDSEDSEAGGASMARAVPPTHPRSFSISSSNTTTATAATSSSALPHRLPPSSTYRPGSSYVPPSIPPSVRPLPSGPRALRAGLGIGVGTGGVVANTAPFTSPVRGFPAAQFAGVPRGPSADRDRDRGWASTVRGRGRGTMSGSSWGR